MHNRREKKYDYVREDLTHLNESWEKESIQDARKRIEETYVKNVGQKMQKKATPIREGVVLIKPGQTMADLHRLKDKLEEKFGIKTIQMYIHRDEGHWKAKDFKQNLHAHMVFDWTDEKGKSLRLKREHLSELQDITANVLQMERGQKNNARKHLKPVEFKVKIATEQLNKLQQEQQELQNYLQNKNNIMMEVLEDLEDKKKISSEKKKELKDIQKELSLKKIDFSKLENQYKELENILEQGKKEAEELITKIDNFDKIIEEKEKNIHKIDADLEQKQAKYEVIHKNNINLDSFKKTQKTGFFGGEKVIYDDEKILEIVNTFSFQKKMIDELKKIDELNKRNIENLKFDRKVLQDKYDNLINKYQNPTEDYLDEKLRQIKLAEKEKFNKAIELITNKIKKNSNYDETINLDKIYLQYLAPISNRLNVWQLMNKHYEGGQTECKRFFENLRYENIINKKIAQIAVNKFFTTEYATKNDLEDMIKEVCKENKLEINVGRSWLIEDIAEDLIEKITQNQEQQGEWKKLRR